jgi:uncharacterized Zn finger protein (UPF0148 family)
MFSVTSDRPERDTSAHGMNTLSNSSRPNREKMFWGWIEDEFGNIIDINCPYCKRLIHHTATGRMICPTCGRSVGDHNKEAIDADSVIVRSFNKTPSEAQFFRQAKDANRRIQGGSPGCQPKADPEPRADQETTGRRREARCTTRY